jgi:anaerobic selenocysteine-containing dehydrogenase
VKIDEASQRIIDVRGDHDNEMTMGYACIKGLQAAEIHQGPQRLLHPLKRQPDGTYTRIPLQQALDEIAARIAQITSEYGQDAFGTFHGTQHYQNHSAFYMLQAFQAAMKTRSVYSTMTIDQSAKWVTDLRLGVWAAGRQRFTESDVWMFAGHNPVVSVQPIYGFPALNPVKRLKEAKARGMKLIVIDPRRTETARYADVFLQPYPGEDSTVMAGLIHIILREGWEDRDFCTSHVNGVDALREAVQSYTPDYVAGRAGIDAGDLFAAAKLFAHTAKTGSANSGTGTNMGPHSNLAEHLLETLNVICGRYLREGQRVPNPGAMKAPRPIRAEVIAPTRSWEHGYRSRVRGLGMMYGQKMAGAIADEILTPGEGQVRALLVVGGNPANALPDRKHALEALAALDLLVCIDPFMSETARLAHYILPPALMFETADLPLWGETVSYPAPFAQYSPAIMPVPADSEVVADWYVFWSLAKRLGLSLTFAGVEIDMNTAPFTESLLEILVRDARVPLEEIKKYPSGKCFELEPAYVEAAQPKRAGNRFEVAPADVVAELREVFQEPIGTHTQIREGKTFQFRLSVRRVREVMNTTYRDLSEIRRRMPFNPLYMHPDDMAANGLQVDSEVDIVSAHGAIRARVEADDSMRRGVISICHGWGRSPGAESYDLDGASANDLIPDSESYVERINSMPWYTAVPVDVVAAGRRVES